MKMIIQDEKEEDHLQVLNKVSEIGIDEVGRGAVFGPVFSAAIVLTEKNRLTLKQLGIKDSKKLTSKKRASLIPLIKKYSEAWSLGQASAKEIDRLGIRLATEKAMIRALQKWLR